MIIAKQEKEKKLVLRVFQEELGIAQPNYKISF